MIFSDEAEPPSTRRHCEQCPKNTTTLVSICGIFALLLENYAQLKNFKHTHRHTKRTVASKAQLFMGVFEKIARYMSGGKM